MSLSRCRQVVALGCFLVLGCAPQTPPAKTPPAQPPVAQPPAQATQPAETANTPSAPVVAQAGVGKKGQSLKNETGFGKMIAAPVVTLFAVEQRAVFDIQLPKAMQLFNATEGRNPKSHEEFMTRIIKESQIKLPELPAGWSYRYHTDDSKLWAHPPGQ